MDTTRQIPLLAWLLTMMNMNLTRIFRPLLLAAFIASLGACGGGGDGNDAGGGGGTQQPSGTLASYAGQYDLQTEDGTTLSVTVDENGSVTSCGAAYTCEGALTLKPGGREASLRLTGNDGQGASGVRVTIDASIDSAGRATGSWSAQSSAGNSSGSLSGAKTPDSPGGGTGNPGVPAVTLASFAGKYNLLADGSVELQFTAGDDGTIRSCVGEVVYSCTGSVTLEPGGQGARFTLSGNDNQQPVDIRVTLNGKIDPQGNVTGSYTGRSEEVGNISGTFTGKREGGASPTPSGEYFKLNGLTWSPIKKLRRTEAGAYCSSLNYNGQKFRLPSVSEGHAVSRTSNPVSSLKYLDMSLIWVDGPKGDYEGLAVDMRDGPNVTGALPIICWGTSTEESCYKQYTTCVSP